MKPFWMFFHVSTLGDPCWHLEKVICEKPHFHYTRLEKIALALTHKIPFLPILGHFLSHLTTTISNPRCFPISRCNNPKNLKKLSQRSGPQCSVTTLTTTTQNPFHRFKVQVMSLAEPYIQERLLFCNYQYKKTSLKWNHYPFHVLGTKRRSRETVQQVLRPEFVIPQKQSGTLRVRILSRQLLRMVKNLGRGRKMFPFPLMNVTR